MFHLRHKQSADDHIEATALEPRCLYKLSLQFAKSDHIRPAAGISPRDRTH
jgi:hypothetical protein